MSNDNQTLIKEIKKSLSKLDKKDLMFLKEQASVLVYNKEIIEKKSQNEKKQSSKSKIVKKSSKKSKTSSVVCFEQLKNPKFFNLNIKGEKLFMDYHEIKVILKIARAAETPEKGAIRLFNWFKKERKDVLVDGGIASSSNPVLLQIYKELLKTFTVD